MNKNNQEPDFNFFLPVDFEKAKDKKGKEIMKIKGIASTPEVDSEGEILEPVGFDLSRFLKIGYLNYNHLAKNDASKIIGEPTLAKVTPKGELYVEGILYNDHALAKSVWDLANTLESNGSNRRIGFSIEGRSLERDPMNPKRITKVLLTGLAITPTPVNGSTYLEICKGQQKEDYIDLEFDEGLIMKSENEKYLYEFKVGDNEYAINKSFELVEIEKAIIPDIEKDDEKQAKIKKVMSEFKAGTLKSSSGEVVTDKDQALAIAMSEAGIEKSLKFEPGTIRIWNNKKYKKTFNNKWVEIHDGKTKEDYKRLVISLNKDVQRLRKEQKNSVSASRQLDSTVDKLKEIRLILPKLSSSEIDIDDNELEKDMTTSNTAALVPESLDGKKISLTPEIRKGIKLGLVNPIDVIEKATGEGSKGGKVIGHTKSGKPVYEGKAGQHEDYRHYTEQDHWDAADIHDKQSRGPRNLYGHYSEPKESQSHKYVATVKRRGEGYKLYHKEIKKDMTVESSRALMPESLDGKKRNLEPIIKKAILEGIIPRNKIKSLIK